MVHCYVLNVIFYIYSVTMFNLPNGIGNGIARPLCCVANAYWPIKLEHIGLLG